MLSSLLYLIEPTFREPSSGPISQHGAFYVSQDTSTGPTSETRDSQGLSLSLMKSRLPREVYDMILHYEINRLLFLVKAAWQIRTSDMPPISIPNERLAVTRIVMPSNSLRIHLIELGDRRYIGRLSDPTEYAPGSLPAMRHRTTDPEHILSPELLASIKRPFKLRYKDYPLDGITYLATKSDGMGLVDIAFRRRHGTPDWIFNASTDHLGYELSEIRYANVRDLLVISDSLKCRGIIPSNRLGAEPYFHNKQLPPEKGWVDAGFSLKNGSEDWELRPVTDPMAYIAKAEYISFRDLDSISFAVQQTDNFRGTITTIETNTVRIFEDKSVFSVEFSKPPTSLRFTVLESAAVDSWLMVFPFFQFQVDDGWEPQIPRESKVLREVNVHNVLGIWWTRNPVLPSCAHFGAVVSDPGNLTNTLEF